MACPPLPKKGGVASLLYQGPYSLLCQVTAAQVCHSCAGKIPCLLLGRNSPLVGESLGVRVYACCEI